MLLLQGVSNGFRGFMSLQQEQQAQIEAGAADGLSAADLTAVVDQATAAAQKLRRGLDQLWHSFAPTSSAQLPSSSHLLSSPAGAPGNVDTPFHQSTFYPFGCWLPRAVCISPACGVPARLGCSWPVKLALLAMLPSVSHHTACLYPVQAAPSTKVITSMSGAAGTRFQSLPLAAMPSPVTLLSNWAPCTSMQDDSNPFPLVNVAFNSAAATTAVTAANNVTANINTAVMQLQATVDSVRSLLSEASNLAEEEHVDLTQVGLAVDSSLLCH